MDPTKGGVLAEAPYDRQRQLVIKSARKRGAYTNHEMPNGTSVSVPSIQAAD